MKGVRHVTVTCSEGHLDWRPTQGAIRLTMKPQNIQPGQTFEACFITKAMHTLVKISLEEYHNNVNTLETLRTTDGNSGEICIRSRSTSLALYLESQVTSDLLGHVVLNYDVEILESQGQQTDNMQGKIFDAFFCESPPPHKKQQTNRFV